MTARTVKHDTFVIERTYPAAPARVFAAWADQALKSRWFGEPDETADVSFDFRVGGHERRQGRGPDGGRYRYDVLYQDIVPDQRIVYSYDMHLDERRISVSVATVELLAEAGGTRLLVTEQGAYLDGLDTAEQRRAGTAWLLDRLGDDLARAGASS